MPDDPPPPPMSPGGSPEIDMLRDLLEEVREVSRGIVEMVNKVLPDDPDKPRPHAPPD